MRHCPPADVLGRLLDEHLTGDELSRVETHVETCPACQGTLDRLSVARQGPVALLARPADGPPAGGSLSGVIDPLLAIGPAAPAASDLPVVDGYDILGELGRGGMGVVYRAVHRELNRPVALKMVYAGPQLTAQAHQRLRHEARAIARLRHPNIVQVYDVGDHDGRPYFSLELVEGGSLAQRAGGRPQPPAAAARVVEQLARAIDYAHHNGIVHRDLKPANVLLPPGDTIGDGSGLKVTDFGLAKELLAGGERVTETGAMVGTPSYMAPEQARGQPGAAGPAADVYALGAVLYDLLTGRPPFRATSPLETLVQVVHHEPASVTRLQPRVPRDLATICMKCLEKDPRRRYATAADLADDLRRFLDHEPIRARRVGPVGRGVRWAQRNPAPAFLLVVLALVVAGGFAGIFQQWRVAAALADSEAKARTAAQTDRDRATTARRQAEQAAIRLVLDRGIGLCEGREVGPGLLWLARGLEQAARAGATDLEPVFRANLALWAERHVTHRESPALDGPVAGVAARRGTRHVAVVAAGKTDADRGQLVVWDADTWAPVFPPVALDGAGAAVDYSPDDKTIMTLAAGRERSVVSFWDADTGRPTHPAIEINARMSAAAFSPDGTTVVVGGTDVNSRNRGAARVWDVAKGTPAGPALPHPGPVTAVAFSPDGRTVATGDRVTGLAGPARAGGELRLWDVTTGDAIRAPAAHTDAVNAVAFHPGGKVLLTGCADTVGRFWLFDTGVRYGPLLSHPCPVTAVAFSPDELVVLTGGGVAARLGGGQDGAWLWDLTTGSCLAGPLPHPDVVTAVAFAPGGGVVTGGRDGRVRVWALGALRPWVEVQGRVPFRQVSFSADGARVMTVSQPARGGPAAEVWDARTGKPVSRLTLPDRGDEWAFTPDGRGGVAAATAPTHRAGEPEATGAVQFYDTAVAKSQATLPAPLAAVVCVSPDGRVAATGGTDGSVRLWDVAGRRAIPAAHPGHAAAVTALDFSPDGQVLVSGAKDGSVQLWDTRTPGSLPAPPAVEKAVTVARFDPAGRTVLIATEDGVVRLWHLTERSLSASVFVHDPGDSVRSAGFDRTGQFVFTAAAPPGRDWASVRIWDARTGLPTCPPLPGRATATGVAFHPGGQVLAVGGWEGNVRLWDVTTGRPVGPPVTHNGAVTAIAFDAAGEHLAAAGRDGMLRVWPLRLPVTGTPAEVREWAETLTGSSLAENDLIVPRKPWEFP